MDNQDRIKLFADACKESLKVATDNKVGGLGIGRFGALQIGRNTLNGHMIQKEKRCI